MSQERVTRRWVAVLVCGAALALDSGCRSPFQRVVDVPSDEPPAAPVPRVATHPPLPSVSLPTDPAPSLATASPPATRPLATADSGRPQPPIDLENTPLITSSATPLLDRALRRAEALERKPPADPTPSRQANVVRTPARGRTSDEAVVRAEGPVPDRREPGRLPIAMLPDVAAESKQMPTLEPPLPVVSKAGAAKPFRETAPTPATSTPRASKPAAVVSPATPARTVELVGPPILGTRPKATVEGAGVVGLPASLALEDRTAFAIGEPRLCRKIVGFGAFEPIKTGPLRAGQAVLIYCELVGLRYQTRANSHVSRLSSRVALHSTDGALVWEESLGEAEDECRSRRSDNFLACRLTLPPSVEPGEYRLRLIQTDLVARQSASAELPVSIVR